MALVETQEGRYARLQDASTKLTGVAPYALFYVYFCEEAKSMSGSQQF